MFVQCDNENVRRRERNVAVMLRSRELTEKRIWKNEISELLNFHLTIYQLYVERIRHLFVVFAEINKVLLILHNFND